MSKQISKSSNLLDKFWTKEGAIITAFTIYVVVMHTVFPKTMLLIYGTELWEHVDHALKIISNLVSFHERSLGRNLVFNTIRCMSNEVNNHFTFQDRLSDFAYLGRFYGVWLMTWYFQGKRPFFFKYPKVY